MNITVLTRLPWQNTRTANIWKITQNSNGTDEVRDNLINFISIRGDWNGDMKCEQ